jgi:hypothetical protein
VVGVEEEGVDLELEVDLEVGLEEEEVVDLVKGFRSDRP